MGLLHLLYLLFVINLYFLNTDFWYNYIYDYDIYIETHLICYEFHKFNNIFQLFYD
jgi:hypothetical protein